MHDSKLCLIIHGHCLLVARTFWCAWVLSYTEKTYFYVTVCIVWNTVLSSSIQTYGNGGGGDSENIHTIGHTHIHQMKPKDYQPYVVLLLATLGLCCCPFSMLCMSAAYTASALVSKHSKWRAQHHSELINLQHLCCLHTYHHHLCTKSGLEVI